MIREARRYLSALSLRHNLSSGGSVPADSLLAQALDQRLQRAKDRIYRLLSLLFPWKDIAAAQWTLANGEPRARASASEYLDNILSGELRKVTVPVLEEMPVDERVRRANVIQRTRPRNTEDTLLELINDDDQVIAAAAIDVVRQQQLWTLAPDVEHVLAHRDVRDWYVFEEASWALAEQRMPAERRRELWLEPLPAAVLADRLRELALFRSVSVDELFRIASAARQVRHDPGTTLMTEGTAADAVHLLLDGRVTASSAQATPAVIDAPAALGFAEALEGAPLKRTIRTAGVAVTLAMTTDELRTLLADNAELVRGLFAEMANRSDGPGCRAIESTNAARDLERPLAVVPDRETAYPLFKVANALLFTVAAIPIYLVARRLLPAMWSLGVAVLSLAIPTSASVSLVMTESASYATCSLALLAIVLALERPTVVRQLAVLGAIALACLVRVQFAALLPAFVVALLAMWVIVPATRPRALRDLSAFWPTLATLAAGLAVVAVVPLVSGSAPVGLPGAYEELWAEYDAVSVAKLAVYHLAGLELYLAVIPLAVSPIVLLGLVRRARAGSTEAGAFASAFVAVNLFMIFVAAAFASTSAGFGHLHDRYLFYVVPLWLVVFAVWLHEGLPRPLLATGLGVALALVLPAVLPFDLLAGDGMEEGAAVTYFWSEVNTLAFERFPEAISGQRVLAAFVIALVLLAVLLPRRLRVVLAVVVASLLVAATAVAWRDSVQASNDFAGALTDDRGWVDARVDPNTTVTSIYVSASCGWAPWTSSALLLTEFFNPSVSRAAHVGEPDRSLLPSTPVRLAAGGALVDDAGRPLVADAVLAARGVEVAGRRLATGTTLPLVLWDVRGPVRLADPVDAAELRDAVCAGERPRGGRSAPLPSPG